MDENHAIKLFENEQIRVHWDAEKEKWYFSIIDIVAVLTQSKDSAAYWRKLKQRLREEGNQTVTNCHTLKMQAADKKMRSTDVADTQQVLRLVQSIPSKKAEPFKVWLAEVGRQRIDETTDPEQSIDRALKTYLKKGYSKEWINQRLKTIEVRKELTDEWQRVHITKESDFAILTNEITKAWAEKDVKEYKQFKGLKKENLRDNMTNLELILNMLAEATTTEFSKEEDPDTFEKSKEVAQRGGSVAGNTRKDIESQLKRSIISDKNAKKNPKQLTEKFTGTKNE